MKKHSALIDLIKLPKDTEKCPHVLVQLTANRINKGFLVNGERGSTQGAMFVDDSLIVDV